MGIFNVSPEEKWIKSKQDTTWNRMFTGFDPKDVLITKCMVWYAVLFADELLSSDVFETENTAIRVETILLAKMQFYHLVTKSATIHNMFYGYVFELFVNHYKMSIGDAYSAISKMHSAEDWYLTWYYNYYESNKGNFAEVLRQYCNNAKINKCTDGKPILSVTTDQLALVAARLLMTMHNQFIKEMP